jgi:hypothetical protein
LDTKVTAKLNVEISAKLNDKITAEWMTRQDQSQLLKEVSLRESDTLRW